MTVTVTDGRTLRRVRNKDAAVDAILDLLQEGVTAPTAQLVAERSGVSLRSIFRLFDDVEGLNAAAVQRQATRINALLVPLPDAGPLFVRVAALVESRATVWEAITPVRRYALGLSARSEVIAGELARTHRFFRRQVRDVFAHEVAGDDELLDALDAAASWETWELLRAGRGLSRAGASRVVTRTLTALLTDKEHHR